jgi:hypothetical protein
MKQNTKYLLIKYPPKYVEIEKKFQDEIEIKDLVDKK